MPKCECLSIRPFLPFGPRHHAIPQIQRKQSFLPNKNIPATAGISAESSEEIFPYRTGFVTKFGPQISLLPVPISDVNICSFNYGIKVILFRN
jgi:hypothetical protein